MDNNNFNNGQPDYSQPVYSAPTPDERAAYQANPQPVQPQAQVQPQPVQPQVQVQAQPVQPQVQPQAQPQQPVYNQPVYTEQPTYNTQADYGQPQPTYQQSQNVTYQTNYGQADAPKASVGMGIASMVLGIVSLVLCCTMCFSTILSILAIVFGIVQLVSKHGAGKGFCIAGLVTGGIAFLITVLAFIGNYSNYVDYKNSYYSYGLGSSYDSFLEYYLDQIFD